MTVELNLLSYILLSTILSAASIIAIKSVKHPDVHPLVMNRQGEFSPLRYPKESSTIKSKLQLNELGDERIIKNLRDFYQFSLLKYTANKLLGTRLHNNSKISWSHYGQYT